MEKKKSEMQDERDDRFRTDPYHELAARTYESLLKDRIILLNGDVKENIIEKVGVQIIKMSREKPRTPITLLINSYGGNADDGQAIVDLIRQTKTPVITVGLGKVMSMAFDIFLAGDLRVANENTLFMCHAGSDTISDRLPMLNTMTNLYKECYKRWANYYASRTKWSYKKWYNVIVSGKDRFFFPEEALKIGIVTDIQKEENQKLKPTEARKKSRKSKKRKNK